MSPRLFDSLPTRLIILRHPLFEGEGRQAAGSGQIDRLRPDLPATVETCFFVDGNTGMAGNMLIGSGQQIKGVRFAGILLPGQTES